jgi:hypothetical protein
MFDCLQSKNIFLFKRRGKNEMKKIKKKKIEPGVISEQNEQEFLTQMHYFSDWVSPFWALNATTQHYATSSPANFFFHFIVSLI